MVCEGRSPVAGRPAGGLARRLFRQCRETADGIGVWRRFQYRVRRGDCLGVRDKRSRLPRLFRVGMAVPSAGAFIS